MDYLRQMLMDLSCMRIGTKTCVSLVMEKMVASNYFRFLSSLFFSPLLPIKIIRKFAFIAVSCICIHL